MKLEKLAIDLEGIIFEIRLSLLDGDNALLMEEIKSFPNLISFGLKSSSSPTIVTFTSSY